MNGPEIIKGLTGAWWIITRDKRARDCFDISAEGALRSFVALFLSLPIIFFSTTASWRIAQSQFSFAEDISFGLFVLAEIASALLYWAAFLGAMMRISRMLRLESGYTAWLVTYNWGSLLTTLAFAIPLIPFSLGLYSAETAVFLAMPSLMLLVWYRWQIAREVLGADKGTAFAILVFDLVLSLSIDQVLGMLLIPGSA